MSQQAGQKGQERGQNWKEGQPKCQEKERQGRETWPSEDGSAINTGV